MSFRTACAPSPRGTSEPVRRLQHQQHAFGAGELRGFVDQEFMQLRGAAQLVQAQPRIHQPLERLAQVRFACEMGGPPLRRQAALARVLEPRMDNLAVPVDLVQVVASQTLIAQSGDALQQESVGHLERFARGRRLLVGLQGLAVPPPRQRW
jgi:hypothetical protein